MTLNSSEPPSSTKPAKEKKKGFSVGPDNLPDGVHRRKVQKIKKNLIRKAELKKSYSKLKAREPELYESKPVDSVETEQDGDEVPPAASLELHPDRQAMLDTDEPKPPVQQSGGRGEGRNQRRARQSRPAPFKKEAQLAQQRREEREVRQNAFEKANREREAKRDERERFRKAMAKARTGGRDGGQRKLGRESKVLLEKVQRMVDG